MSNGASTDIFFKPKRREQTRENLYDAILGQRQDPEDFLLETPDRPEMDEERRRQLQRLSRVSAIGAGVDALTDAIGVGVSDRYAPASTGIGELGVTTFDELSRMDRRHRDRLEDWRENVLDTRRTNQQARQQVGQYNAGVDLQEAEQKYQDYITDAEANERAEDIIRENTLRDQRDYRRLANRMVSQGEVAAGAALAEKGGLPVEEIYGIIGETPPGQGPQGNGAQQGGGTADYDPEMGNMVREFYELRDRISDIEGEPNAALMRELEWLDEQTRGARFNPRYREQVDEGATTAADDEATTQRQPGEAEVEYGRLLEDLQNAGTEEERDRLLREIETTLQDLGYDQAVIGRQIEALLDTDRVGTEQSGQSENPTIGGEYYGEGLDLVAPGDLVKSDPVHLNRNRSIAEIESENQKLVDRFRETDNEREQNLLYEKLWLNWSILDLPYREKVNRINQLHESGGDGESDSTRTRGTTGAGGREDQDSTGAEAEFTDLIDEYANAEAPVDRNRVLTEMETRLKDLGYDESVINRQLEAFVSQFGRDNQGRRPDQDEIITDGDDHASSMEVPDPDRYDQLMPSAYTSDADTAAGESRNRSSEELRSIAEENRGLVQQVLNSGDRREQRRLAGQLIENWRDVGFTQEEIDRGLRELTRRIGEGGSD